MPSSTACDIPTDIWLCIAQFIPHKELRDLYGVNRAFLHLALDERYRDVDFLQVNPKTLRFLEHVRDSNIATRVRRLRVNPVWFKLPASTKISLPHKNSILRRIRSKAPPWLDFSHRTSTTATAKQQAEREAIDTLTISIVTLFPNITSFAIVTRYSPHPHSLPLFLSNAWATFGSTLTRLTINAPLGGFSPLLPSPSALPSLAELTLRFSTDLTSTSPATDTALLTHTIAPFLLALARQLTRLTLLSSALGDHAALFSALALGPFKKLRTLSLAIGFYPPLLSSPGALTSFLCASASTLKHVRFQPHESFRAPAVGGPAHAHFGRWMATLCEDVDGDGETPLLSGLRSLVISPSTDLPPGLDASSPTPPPSTRILARSVDTLTSLVLGDVRLPFADLKALVGAFAHRPRESGLRTLYVKLRVLSPRVFDLLAERLPGLEDLDVRFNVLLADVEGEGEGEGEGEEMGDGEGREGDRAPEDEDIAAFLAQMSTRVYPHWGLYALWIWQRSHMTTKTAHEILERLRGSIPAVRVVHRMDHGRHLNMIFN